MKKIFIAVLAVAAALTACNKAEIQAPVSDASRVVKFTADNFYTFETKAAMESGTVGIWAGAPINANNQTYTISGSNLTGNSILWGIEQAGTTTPSNFFAMYPRNGAATFTHGTGYTYSVRTDSGDNKDADIITAEEFMVAATKAAPGTGETPAPVAFSFSHPFAKIVYNVTNNSDDAVRYATIAGVYWTGNVNYTDSETLGALTVTATASGSQTTGAEGNYEYLNGGEVVNGKHVFHTITMPATGLTPVIKIVMWSGATYTFNIDGTLNAKAGKEYTAEITLTHTQSTQTNGRTMSASFTATDWTAGTGPAIQSGDGYVDISTWPVIKGVNFELVRASVNIASGDWSTAMPMTCVGENLYRAVIKKTSASGNNIMFKVVVPGSPDVWYGTGDQTEDSGWQKYTGGEGDIVWGGDVDQLTTIYFNSYSHNIFVNNGDVTRTF